MALKLEGGQIYYNARDDELGPMKELVSGLAFADQFGRCYNSNGLQWGHHPESTGNITRQKAETGSALARRRK